mgnify:FL=1
MTLLAIDPGVAYCGYAVLSTKEHLETSGTIIPKRLLRGIERHLWLLSKIQDLIRTWQPTVLALEDFVWMTVQNGERPVIGRDSMAKLVGGIEALSLFPPYPLLYEVLSSKWGTQLVGSRRHTKADIACVVNLRLRTTFRGDFHDNHEADAVGIALVVNDLLMQQMYQESHTFPAASGPARQRALAIL